MTASNDLLIIFFAIDGVFLAMTAVVPNVERTRANLGERRCGRRPQVPRRVSRKPE